MSKPTTALSFVAAAAVALATAIPATAASPSGAPGEPVNYLGVAHDYSDWSLTAYFGSATKNYKNKPEIDFTRINATVGYNMNRWATIYCIAGVLEQKVDTYRGSVSENAGVFGVGMWFNLIETDQLSRFTSVDRYTLTAGLEGTFSKNDFGTYASLDGFLFFEIQGDINKSAFIFPDSIGIYLGPVVSFSVSPDYDTSSSNVIGFGGGLNVKFTDDINLKVGGDASSDDSSFYAQFSINF